MAGNRYYSQSVHELFEIYEFPMKELLEKVDNLARVMYFDLDVQGVKVVERHPLMQQFFADCWNQVSETQKKVAESHKKGSG